MSQHVFTIIASAFYLYVINLAEEILVELSKMDKAAASCVMPVALETLDLKHQALGKVGCSKEHQHMAKKKLIGFGDWTITDQELLLWEEKKTSRKFYNLRPHRK